MAVVTKVRKSWCCEYSNQTCVGWPFGRTVACSVALAGATSVTWSVTMRGPAGSTCTSSAADAAPLPAVRFAEPAATPVTLPAGSTDSTSGFDDVQEIVRPVIGLLRASNRLAV